VHDIILSLPDGYDTQVNGSAVSLSGGQKQRLALARALYDDPVILVLDEPNSALDAEGSEALNAAVNAMKAEGRAVLIMTHRPTAISTCDNLLVLDGGKVAAFGPRDEIIKKLMKNAGDVQRVVRGGSNERPGTALECAVPSVRRIRRHLSDAQRASVPGAWGRRSLARWSPPVSSRFRANAR
jgi:ABC-type protease/lipase transport system fused ATPase/permease subunit